MRLAVTLGWGQDVKAGKGCLPLHRTVDANMSAAKSDGPYALTLTRTDLTVGRMACCQSLINRYAKRSVLPLIEGSNALAECGSSLFASAVLSASSTNPAVSTSTRTVAGSIRCSDSAGVAP